MSKPNEVAESETWQQLLNGERPGVLDDHPQAGYYKRRLVKNGPWVAARIWIDEVRDESGKLVADQRYHCLLDGKPADAFAQWSWLASHAIPEDEYQYLIDNAAWCRRYDPDDPSANPTRPINLRTTKPILPPKRNRA